jgi:hypothetical protein
MKKISLLLALVMIFASVFSINAQAQRKISSHAKGAVIGGLGGAAAGAIINKRNRVVGGAVGGAAGAGLGYVIGKNADNKRKAEAARVAAANRAEARRVAAYRAGVAKGNATALMLLWLRAARIYPTNHTATVPRLILAQKYAARVGNFSASLLKTRAFKLGFFHPAHSHIPNPEPMKTYFGLLLAAASLASCSTDKKPAEAVNVQALNQQFIGAWNSRNTAQLDTLLADDIQYSQGETHFKGKSEVSDKWVRATLGTITDLKTYATSSGTDAQTAYEAGTFSTEVVPETPGTPRGEGEGNFILLWKKNAKNAWKLSYVQLEGLPVKIRN